LDAIQAAVLQIKLKRLVAWNDERRKIARRYNELLSSVDSIVLPYEPQWSRAVYHLYVIRLQKRDALQLFLANNNISTGLHYPIPLHRQKAYAAAKINNGSLAVSERTAREIISLPIFPGLTDEQQSKIAKSIIEFVNCYDSR
jgi:dTDP-4-amino-4,6-dideoxygalactose transaminase